MSAAESKSEARNRWRNEYVRTGRLPLSAIVRLGLRDALTQPFWMFFKFLGGTIGFKSRQWLYQHSLAYQGKGALIDIGVEITNPQSVHIGRYTLVDKYVSLHAGTGSIRVGERCHFAPYAMVLGHGGVVIEDYVAIAAGARIFSISDWPGKGKRVCGPMVPDEHRNLNRAPVAIKKDVFIGLNAVILPGVTVGEGAVIGANAVVSKDIEPWKIAVGAPAKPIGERDPVTVPDLP